MKMNPMDYVGLKKYTVSTNGMFLEGVKWPIIIAYTLWVNSFHFLLIFLTGFRFMNLF